MNESIFVGEISINASRARVWQVLSTSEFATQWAGVFGDDAPSFSGEWKAGGEWLAWNENGDGIVSRLLRCDPEKFVEFEYVAVLKKHARCDLTGDDAEWKEVRESFFLSDDGEGCVLSVRSGLPKSMREFLMEKWPLVLQKIKELAEGA